MASQPTCESEGCEQPEPSESVEVTARGQQVVAEVHRLDGDKGVYAVERVETVVRQVEVVDTLQDL